MSHKTIDLRTNKVPTELGWRRYGSELIKNPMVETPNVNYFTGLIDLIDPDALYRFDNHKQLRDHLVSLKTLENPQDPFDFLRALEEL